ncbi:MAG: hypothetical protein U0S13_04355 [Mycobacterium sp.]
MRTLHLGSAVVVAAGVVAAGISSGTAWAGGPEGGAPNDLFEAVGSGTFDDTRDGPGGASTEVGFRATGATAGQASAAVVAACQAAGGVDCTSDEVTNDNLCIVSVFDPGTNVDAGGAGPTVEAARQDAIQRAAANNTPMSPAAAVLISACP